MPRSPESAVVLNCAGPFSRTAAQLVAACLRAKVHYLDITGELAVLEGMAGRDDQARAAGITLLPGAGFDVVRPIAWPRTSSAACPRPPI